MRALSLLCLLATPFAAQASPQSQALYEAMPGPIYTVEYREGDALILGSTILEKSSETQICQRVSPVIPNPPSNYFCWERIFTGDDARFTFEGSDAVTLAVSFWADGLPLVGIETKQRGLPSGFCRRRGPVVPNPEYSYACFNRLP
jgi:hypothetical protein